MNLISHKIKLRNWKFTFITAKCCSDHYTHCYFSCFDNL